MTQKHMAVFCHLQNNINFQKMNNLQKNLILLFIASITLIFGSSCKRTASCPAYHSVDPTKSNLSMSKEKFMNPVLSEKPEDNKKDVDKRKKAELSKTYNRKKSYNLFPAYMR